MALLRLCARRGLWLYSDLDCGVRAILGLESCLPVRGEELRGRHQWTGHLGFVTLVPCYRLQIQTSQELRVLSSVTLYCQVTMSGVEDLNCLTCTLVLVFSKCLCLCFLGNSNDLTYVPKSLCVLWVSERQGHLELSSDSAKNTETQIYKITQIEGVFCQFYMCFSF